MTLSEELRQELQTLVATNPVVLFMKGKRRMPQCGFSAQVVQILDEVLEDYETVNVLENPGIREGIKAFSDWPTIPQLYVKGQFLGGCDIVVQMYQNGDLHQALGVEVPDVASPELTITPAAAENLLPALQQAGPGHRVRVSISASFHPGLEVDGPRPGDFELESSGVPLLIDRMSASRANGLLIDFVPGESGGFRIDNPNEPPRVREMQPEELLRRQQSGDPFELIDVRTPEERETASIEGSTLLTAEEDARIDQLDKDVPLVFFCHHGNRSLKAAQNFLARGFRRVYNLRGGIDAWALRVDTSVPRY